MNRLKKSRKANVFSIFGVIIFIYLVLFSIVLFNSLHQDFKGSYVEISSFSDFDYNAKNAYCLNLYNNNYTGNVNSPGPYCTNSFSIDTREYTQSQAVNETDFREWYVTNYYNENSIVSKQVVNIVIDFSMFFGLISILIFSIYSSLAYTNFTNEKLITIGVMGVPGATVVIYIFQNIFDWLRFNLLGAIFPNITTNILDVYPLLSFFVANLYVFLITYFVLYILGLAINFNLIWSDMQERFNR